MLALVAHRETATNLALAAARPAGVAPVLLTPDEALSVLGPGDVAVGRLDVRPTLDGVEPGLNALAALAERGVHVLNPPNALLTAHDKLLTARALGSAGVPHPRVRLLLPGRPQEELELPAVVKPRFGSWGRDVFLCRDAGELEAALTALAGRSWFRRQGAIVQELVPLRGHDLRLVVAGGTVVGAVRRLVAPGEWRTNVALGGLRRAVDPPAEAVELALAAAGAADADLVGVDLLPADGGYVVLELNGAVDFTAEYARGDVFSAAVEALASRAAERPRVAAAAGA
jgi:RimK family alpha-L-glutamate ligase